MLNAHSFIPFIVLKTIISTEHRRLIAQRALEYKSKATPAAKNNLTKKIDKWFRIDGFSQRPSLAPPSKIIGPLVRAINEKEIICEAVLDVWRESYGDLDDAIAREIGRLSELPVEIFEFENEAVIGWTDEVQTIVTNLTGQFLDFDPFIVELMFACQINPANHQEPDQEQPRLSAEMQNDFVDETNYFQLNSPFERWLAFLQDLPDTADDWDQLTNFISDAQDLLVQRGERIENEKRRPELIAQLKAFLEQNKKELEYHDFPNLLNVDFTELSEKIASISIQSLEDLCGISDRLLIPLQQYADVRQQNPVSKAEKAEYREKEIALEGEIELILADFIKSIHAALQFGNFTDVDDNSREASGEFDAEPEPETPEETESDDDAALPSGLEAQEFIVPEQNLVDGDEDKPLDQSHVDFDESVSLSSEDELAARSLGKTEPEAQPLEQNTHLSDSLSDESQEKDAVIENDESQNLVMADLSSYSILPQQNSSEIAAQILQNGIIAPTSLRDLIWLLISEEKTGLAFHLSRCQKDGESLITKKLPTRLIRALICGRHVRLANGEIAVRLSDDFARFGAECFEESDDDWGYGIRFLVLSAALRPALLAPTGGAASVLHNLNINRGNNFNKLYKFCEFVQIFSQGALPLDLSSLKSVRDVNAWEIEANILQNQLKSWREQAKQYGFTYTPARQVWLNWLNDDGMFGQLLTLMEKNDLTSQQTAELLEKAKSEVVRLSIKTVVDEEIESARLSLKHPGNGFEPSAVRRLNSSVEETLAQIKKWVEVQESSPHLEHPKYSQGQAKTLIDNLKLLRFEVEAEIAAFMNKMEPGGFAQIGASVLQRSLKDLWRLLEAENDSTFTEPSLKYLLNANLLRLNVPLDENWEAECSADELEKRILETLSCRGDNWTAAFNDQLERGDHEATDRILKFLRSSAAASKNEEIDLTAFAERRERHLQESLAALRRELEETKKMINEAFDLGLLKTEYEDYKGKIEGIELLLPSASNGRKIRTEELDSQILRFDKRRGELENWRQTVKNKRGAEIDRARRQLDQLEPIPEIREKIEKLLEQGDAGTAWDFLERLEQNLPLYDLDADRSNAFARFFPETFRQLWQYFLHKFPVGGNSTIIRDLREFGAGTRDSFHLGPLDFGNVSGEINHLIEMLEAWFTLRKLERIDENSVCSILRGLGFANPKIHLKTKISPKNFRAEMTCDPISDRNFCPTPAYGSNAKGNYNILLVFDAQTTPEEVIKNIGETIHQATPQIVFYFGRMNEDRRRALARLSRDRSRTLIVLDEILLWFLAAEPSPRLRPFFEATLPFSFGEPYTTTAGYVPDEMFYGRTSEYNSIIDPHGACFIFGGRQLGKTALLRYVERRFHNPSEERLALFFDVKTNGICRDLNIDDIWTLLIEKFKSFGIQPKKNLRAMETFLKMLEEWVLEKPLRRVILLLDEADEFLEVDGKGIESSNSKQRGEFVRADRLKGLMEKTDRRFKVVFAGLHNVQRTTTLVNHPLAHFGTPICIGPLIEKNERREAQNLIRIPLESYGYLFEDENLAARILWQTNHYPSLIQLYSRRLLAHLNDRAATPADTKTSPPFIIRTSHLEEAYNQNFRMEIRQRLIWTLQLDTRYEVIGYAMIFASLSDPERARREGFSVDWVRNEANYWWADGFEGSNSEEAIRVLLDEMVGLGLLRSLENQNYTLRSVNIASLMGTQKQIEEVLCREREKPLTYEPATFRAALRRVDGSSDSATRSPLTAQQESALQRRENGLNILFGCDAAGLNNLTDFLKNRFGENLFVKIEHLKSKDIFREKLREVFEKRGEGISLILVSPDCEWNSDWLNEARRSIDALTSANKLVQVLFVADPKTLWSLLRNETEVFEEARTKTGANIFNLRPWHDAAVRQWLDDCGFALELQHRGRVAKATGNWSDLLERFYRAAHNNAADWQSQLEQLENLYHDPAFAVKQLARFGFGSETEEPQNILTEIAELGDEVTEADLRELLGETVTNETLSAALKWADALGLAFNGKNGWQLQSPLTQLLKTQKKSLQ